MWQVRPATGKALGDQGQEELFPNLAEVPFIDLSHRRGRFRLRGCGSGPLRAEFGSRSHVSRLRESSTRKGYKAVRGKAVRRTVESRE